MAMTQMTRPTQWFRRGNRMPSATGMSTDPLVGRDDPFSRLHNEMNRLVDSFFGDADWTFSQSTGDGSGLATVFQPQLDIFETKDSYKMSVELPGVDRDSIDLSVDDDALIIRARKEREVSEGDDNQFHRVERSFGRFERMLTLPADADTENIGAELKNGVLEVTIPRNREIESTRGRRIEIKS